jgi:hypothetical protein
MELPVNLTQAKIQLTPIFEELTRTMPEAKRQMSPGYQALRELIHGPDVMDAVTADRNLSAIKALARKGNNQFLNNRSQGLAKAAIARVESDFDAALNAADSSILPKLRQARDMVRKQHTVAEILNSLPDEPAALYQRLTSAGDRTFNDLAFLNNVAPREMRQIGRTYLDGLFQKATAEGGFARTDGLWRDWQRLGPKTKALLFGNQQAIRELDNFFLAAKQLSKDPNPSGTAKMISAFGLLGAAYDAGTTPGGPKEKAERLATDVTAFGISSNILSRLLLTPNGTKFLTAAMRLPPSSQGFRQAVNGVYSLLTPEEKAQAQGGGEVKAEAVPAEAPAPQPDQASAVAELYRRRDSLTPEQRATVEELARRHGIEQ